MSKMTKDKLVDKLLAKRGYLRWSATRIADLFNTSQKVAKKALKEAKNINKIEKVSRDYYESGKSGEMVNNILSNYCGFPDLYGSGANHYTTTTGDLYNKSKLDPNNVLFIADLHAPWILDGYLEWCYEEQQKYNCGTVIFAGDIIDGASWNYHEKDVDGMSVKDELYAAKKQLKEVYKLFPNAISLYGNHCLLISRKAKTAGLSQEFIRDFGDIIEAPKTWQFHHEYMHNGVMYKHGNTSNAFKTAVASRMSTCQGHFHSETFVQWSVSEKDAIFGLQIGAGFDRNKYAFAYAKPFPKKPIISLGLILESGQVPLVKLMKL